MNFCIICYLPKIETTINTEVTKGKKSETRRKEREEVILTE